MPSSKALRAEPTRTFENYTFNRIISPEVSLYPVATTTMERLINAGVQGADDGISSAYEIGFDFNLDGRIYKKFIVSVNGWCILQDPANSSIPADVMAHCMTTEYNNTTILAPFGSSTNHVLLCPWFDDLRNVYSDQQTLLADFAAPTVANQNRINLGLDISSVRYNETIAGVRFKRTTDKSGKRCLVVRWNSLSNYAMPSTLLKFDLVIYENGEIEFRYLNNSTITSSTPANENATIGIFLNNDASVGWRFRDFSYGLGYDDNKRPAYRLGGAVYNASYTDNAIQYTNRLRPDIHWPGLRTQRCIMSFAPPKNRRKVLPRQVLRTQDSAIRYPLIARTGDRDRMGTYLSPYDDRRSINYGSGVVDYPTRLQRIYAQDESSALARLNVFGNFEVTASIDKNSADNFIGEFKQTFIEPFNEVNQPEQNGSTSTYFTTGSNIDELGYGLSSPLTSKTQIRLELPIEYSTKMFDVTSSIYYYNKTSRGFFVPRNAQAGKDIVRDPVMFLTAESYPEDARGFSALGTSVSSGSLPGSQTTSRFQTDQAIGPVGTGFGVFQGARQSEILSRYYSKSVQNNSEYKATTDEQFTLPINHPFLIEKVVFEMPFTMGAGWLNDKTTSGLQVKTGGIIATAASFDVAGPAITVALYNQVDAGTDVTRDLILTGTIIPSGDNIKNLKSYESRWAPVGPSIPFYIFSPEGFLSYGCTPSAVVSANTGTNFTGSVIVPTVAGISNGITIGYLVLASDLATITADQVAANQQLTKKFLTSEFTNIDYDFSVIASYVKDIDVFGRSGRSFDPSGRSVFGKEFITTQGTAAGPGKFRNPLFVSSSYDDFPQRIKSAISDPAFSALIATALPLSNPVASPYLVMPGDKLTLAISKMRPMMYSMGTNPIDGSPQDYFTGALRHDVSISTGSIKMTIYGSLLREASEFHDTLNSSIASNAIHETLGNDPVLDQFDVEPRSSYYGSMTDDYITGSMLTRYSLGGHSYFTQGSRGKVFSKYLARTQAVPAETPSLGYEAIKNPSKAFRLQPWFERVGNDRTTQATSTAERYYDSMMPSLRSCFKVNGAQIFILDSNSSLQFGGPNNVGRSGVGYLFFNSYGPAYGIYDDTWTWSYPFEPRYSHVTRELNIKSIMTSNALLDENTGTTVKIDKVPLTDLIFINRGFYGYSKGTPGSSPVNNSYEAWTDVMLSSNTTPLRTGSMTFDDMSRTLFGFGDANNVTYRDTIANAGSYIGSSSNGVEAQPIYGGNHLPEFRDNEYFTSAEVQTAQGPIIRGWKYGAISGLPLYSKCIWRRNRYGQLRDMLEQRPYTKYYITEDVAASIGGRPTKEKPGVLTGPITVRFVDSSGNTTSPELTWSQNLSLEVTSSFPYLDGEYRNRSEVDIAALNQSTVLI